uniref:Uncharacterized protein n=1 Tax=Leptobrachium leishanense TaxID=445787 RepID=A0A8C5PX57_9ANUR
MSILLSLHSLLSAYFALQVIAARRKYKISPPTTSGPPEFERVFRAQINCSEYFPMFLAVLWMAGIFFHQGRDIIIDGPYIDYISSAKRWCLLALQIAGKTAVIAMPRNAGTSQIYNPNSNRSSFTMQLWMFGL